MGESLSDLCDRLRVELLGIEKQARAAKLHPDLRSAYDAGECIGQAMLAVRHIEDARMRLGKVLQHARDGVSIFDQGKTPAAESSIKVGQIRRFKVSGNEAKVDAIVWRSSGVGATFAEAQARARDRVLFTYTKIVDPHPAGQQEGLTWEVGETFALPLDDAEASTMDATAPFPLTTAAELEAIVRAGG